MVEVQQTDGGRSVVRALASSGGPVFGVMLANLFTRGFSWGDLGAMVVIWTVLFSVLLFLFSRRERFGRRR